MDDLEMQFADPEWQPPKQRSGLQVPQPEPLRPNGEPPPDQSQWQAPPQPEDTQHAYEAGYRVRQQQKDDVQDQRHGGRRSIVPLIIGLLIVLAVFGVIFGKEGFFFFEIGWLRSLILLFAGLAVFGVIISMVAGGRRATSVNQMPVETRTFLVGSQPTLVIKEEAGTIRVHTGEGESNQVIVQATKQSRGWMSSPDKMQISYAQKGDGNTITVKADGGWSIFGRNSVDFDVTVPRYTDLKLKTDAGKIQVMGVSGQMSLTSDAGSIQATQVMLNGHSTLKTDVGSVTLEGAIDPTGSYELKTDVGSINVTLPGNASFHVVAKTDVGSFNSNFPVASRRDVPGARADGDVGASPHAKLTLKTDVGSINLFREA
jgi:hypothetical protein